MLSPILLFPFQLPQLRWLGPVMAPTHAKREIAREEREPTQEENDSWLVRYMGLLTLQPLGLDEPHQFYFILFKRHEEPTNLSYD